MANLMNGGKRREWERAYVEEYYEEHTEVRRERKPTKGTTKLFNLSRMFGYRYLSQKRPSTFNLLRKQPAPGCAPNTSTEDEAANQMFVESSGRVKNKHKENLTFHSPETHIEKDQVDKDDVENQKKRFKPNNFNLEERIEALPPLSLEDFQLKKRSRKKRNSSSSPVNLCRTLEDNVDTTEFGAHCRTSNDPTNKREVPWSKARKANEVLEGRTLDDNPPQSSHQSVKPLNISSRVCEVKSFPEGKSETFCKHTSTATTPNSYSYHQPVRQDSSSQLMSADETVSQTPKKVSDSVVGSRKRKAPKQNITRLEPGSNKKDTSVVEVNVLSHMGLATLADVATTCERRLFST